MSNELKDESFYHDKRTDSTNRQGANDQYVELRITQLNIEQNVLEYNRQV